MTKDHGLAERKQDEEGDSMWKMMVRAFGIKEALRKLRESKRPTNPDDFGSNAD